MNFNFCFTLDTKINSKWIRGINVKVIAIKLVEGNIRCSLEVGKDFFKDRTHKALILILKSDKLDYKFQNFCSLKNILKENEKASHRVGKNIYNKEFAYLIKYLIKDLHLKYIRTVIIQ